MYKLLQSLDVTRISDGAYIPANEGNRDYVDYLAWVSEGNTPEPADPPPAVYPRLSVRDFLALFTPEEKLAVKAATRVNDTVSLVYDEMMVSQYISAEDPAVEQGLQVYEAAGLITAARKAEVLAAMQPTA